YIGILYAYAGEHLVMPLQQGIDEVFRDTRYLELRFTLSIHDQIYNQDRKQIFIDKIIQDKSIAGLLSVFLPITEANIARIQKNGIPVVLLNNYSDCGKCVLIDHFNAGFEATTELLKLGRKKVGLIMPEETSEWVWEKRLSGYKKALLQANLEYDPYLLVYEHTFSLKESARATKTLLEREPAIDAIFYGSDIQAYAGMEALKELGKRVPEDIAVLGFDDMSFNRITEPPLSSVKQPMFEMGKLGAELLMESIKKKDFSHRAIEMKSAMALRQSTHKEIPREKLL
ncbi:MAG: substrate-binding domain-containing protein, partial [Candidatus Theseobacter exili]|nr:substrate-binding domain-containing protein [Candidatus Theseobacter exili]